MTDSDFVFLLVVTTCCAVVSLEPGYLDWVGDFVFWFNLFPLPSPPNCYLFLRPFPLHSLWSYRLNHPLPTVALVSAVQPLLDYTSLATIQGVTGGTDQTSGGCSLC